MTRLVALVSLIVFADSMLFGAIIPLVPVYAEDLDLSKLQAGLLVGAYGAGALVGGIPGGLLTARVGARRAVLIGLIVLAVSTGVFALATDGALLALSRFAQGGASAVTWAGALTWITIGTPRDRRGQSLGTVFSFAVLGYIVGPIIGAGAELTTPQLAFGVVTVTTLVLAAVASTMPAGPPGVHAPGAVRRAVADPRFVGGLWLTLLPAFFFGMLDVLVPLSLSVADWSAVAIAALFVCSGSMEVALSPLVGRLSDRRGRLYPVRIALVASIFASLALALADAPLAIAPLVVVGALSFSGFTTPGMALVSDRAELAGLQQGLGFGVMNTAWALGAMSGPAVGGLLGDAFSDTVPYLLCTALCGLTLVAVLRVTRRTRAAPA